MLHHRLKSKKRSRSRGFKRRKSRSKRRIRSRASRRHPRRTSFRGEIKNLDEVLKEFRFGPLDLSNRGITDTELRNIITFLEPEKVQLRRLNLSSNQIGPVGAIHLANFLPGTSVEELDLSNNRICGIWSVHRGESGLEVVEYTEGRRDNSGIMAICSLLKEKMIPNLNLRNNHIDNEGASSIAGVLHRVKNLNLSHNNITNINAISEALTDLNRDYGDREKILDLTNNDIKNSAKKALLEATVRTEYDFYKGLTIKFDP